MLELCAIWGVWDSVMSCLCNCIQRSHIFRHRTIVRLLGPWRIYCLLEILSMWTIERYLSRDEGPVFARTVGVVGLNYFPFSEGGVLNPGSIFLGRWCVRRDWARQWRIPACLYLFLLKLGMSWCPVPRLSLFILLGITIESRFGCPIPDKSCVWKSGLLLWDCVVRGGHIVSVVHRDSAA